MKKIKLKLLLALLIFQSISIGLLSQDTDTIIEQPSDAIICLGDSAFFGIKVNKDLVYELQWQIKVSDGWKDLENDTLYHGVDTDKLRMLPDTTFEKNKYSCLVILFEKKLREPVRSDIVQVVINKKPGKAGKPLGDTTICKGNINNYIYITDSLPNAESYNWEINPEEAGTIISTEKHNDTIEVQWHDIADTSASIIVTGVHPLCGEGETSDSLSISLFSQPEQPVQPQGEQNVCGGDTEIYETTISPDATSYFWKLNPDAAGVIVSDSSLSSIEINWASSTLDITAFLSVSVVNPCDTSDFSEDLEISIKKAPEPPDLPTGVPNPCQGEQGVEYTTNQIPGVVYQWNIDPETAGSISWDDNEATLNLSAEYTGNAEITVSVSADCGTSPAQPLVIQIRSKPAVPATPTGPPEICTGMVSSDFEITEADYVDYYVWEIQPPGAGIIDGSSTEATVTWTGSFIGNAEISVYGVNDDCGDGPMSDSYVVEVKEKVTPEIKIEVNENPLCEGDLAEFDVDSYLNAGENPEFFWTVNGIKQQAGIEGFSSTSLADGDIIKGFLVSDAVCRDQDTVSDEIIIGIDSIPIIKDFWVKPGTDIGHPVVLIVCCDSTGRYTYQWFKDGDSLEGETGQYYYQPDGIEEGVFKCRISNNSRCNAFTNEYTYPPKKNVLFAVNNELFAVYPNPAFSEIDIELNSEAIPPGTSSVVMNIFNTTGKKVITEKLFSSVTKIDITHIKAGLYFIELSVNNGTRQTKKLIIH